MKSKIKAFIKSRRFFYLAYYYIGSFFLRCITCFVKTNHNQILFVSYGGKKYDDSPKYLYEFLKDNEKYSNLNLIWAFENPNNFKFIENKVKIDTIKYFIIAAKSKFWITNSSISRGLKFQKKSNINLIFSHGITGLKKCGIDIQEKTKTYRINFIEDFSNIFIEGKNEDKLVAKSWVQDINKIKNFGLPRNDDLVNTSKEDVIKIKKKLNLDINKKIILYAPTFRELQRDKNNFHYLDFPLNTIKWKEKLSDKYQMIITNHYEVENYKASIVDNDFIKNLCNYPAINDLLKIADLLITDYSNILFDYSVFEKPIFCYGYDYDDFSKTRGFYANLNDLFFNGIIKNEETLLNAIDNMDYKAECLHTKTNIKEKYLMYYDGNSTKRIISFLESNYRLLN